MDQHGQSASGVQLDVRQWCAGARPEDRLVVGDDGGRRDAEASSCWFEDGGFPMLCGDVFVL
jgi:hypothetical protein